MTASATVSRPFTVDVIDINYEIHASLERALKRAIPAGIRLRMHVTQGDFRSAVRPDDLPDVLVMSYRQSDLSVKEFVAKLKVEGFDGATFVYTGALVDYVDPEIVVAVDAVYFKPDDFQALANAIGLVYNTRI